jgi:hypothetical protein
MERTSLYRSEYLSVDVEGDLVTLAWSHEEPDDAHATETARQVTAVLEQYLGAHPGQPLRVLADLTVVKGSFPRASAAYTGWLLKHRAVVRAGAFATRNLLLRMALKAATLVPGLTMRGFSDAQAARAFLATAGAPPTKT